ncbi:MAG: vsr [Chitinophagaceae bacterium]|nr:vsr [Chitinophagaceae bacterium]
MTDTFSKEERSRIMAKVKGSETKPEVAVRKYLFNRGYRYRKNVKKLPGSPDIVLKKYNTIIFIHGCFWHGHSGCKSSDLPKSQIEFWYKKITNNAARDLRNISFLKEKGWKVIVIWDCEIKKLLQSGILLKMINDLDYHEISSDVV